MPFDSVLDEFGNIVGNYQQRMNSLEDGYLLFKFPDHSKGPLKIRTGANSINWSYELNTAVTPTVGGEVIQILSCFVGPMTITGMTAGLPTEENVANPSILTTPSGWGNPQGTPADEMEEIIDWFLEYMHLAGTLEEGRVRRVERAIHFLYPKRGWDFYIQVNRLDGFAMNTKTVAVPWSITAEVVSDNALEFMEATTMNTFTDSLVGRDTLYHAISDGYEFERNPFINPSLNDNVLNGNLIKQMGDNFQDLVAAWVSGDFDHYGYSSILLTPEQNNYRKDIDGPQFVNKYDVYTDPEWFGGQGAADGLDAGYFLGTGPLRDYGGAISWGGGTAGPPGGSDTDPGDGSGGDGSQEITCGASKCDIVNRINNLFEAAGMPGKLGVATSIYESGLNPEAANSGGHVGLFQNNVVGSGRASVPQAITDLWRAHPNDNPLKGACQAYPIDLQIKQASQWFPRYKPDSISEPYSDEELHHWATCAQGVGGSPCNPANSQFSLSTFKTYLRQAEDLIKKCAATTTGSCPGPVLSGGVNLSNTYKTHSTSNLEEYGAVDIFGSPGTAVIAPEKLRIDQHGSAQGGESISATGLETGNKYWFGHLNAGDRASVGSTIQRGGKIGSIFNMQDPHVHVGVLLQGGKQWKGCEGYVTGGCGHPTLGKQMGCGSGGDVTPPPVDGKLCNSGGSGYTCNNNLSPSAGMQAVNAWLASKGLKTGNYGNTDNCGVHATQSWHWSGQAIDIGDGGNPSSLIATWNALYPLRNCLAELIWAPTSSSVQAQAPGTPAHYECGTRSTPSGHTDHIHVTYIGTPAQWAKCIGG